MTSSGSDRAGSAAFLLAQLGEHAAGIFAERVATLGLSPQQAGILRAISGEPGRSQQALSQQLGLLPSRLVTMVDELEGRGLLERRRNPTDRRLHALHLSADGEALMQQVRQIARQHDKDLTTGLRRDQRADLLELLTILADQRGLTRGVHPGFGKVGRTAANPAEAS